jgi:metal transporter CNNM
MLTFIIILLLLLASGLFSGLTLGLLALSPQMLKHKKELGDVRAAQLYPLRRNGTQLLITLVLANVAANSILTVLLGNVLFGPIAVVVSTILITVCTEILPQATIGRYGLKFAPPFAPFVGLLMKVTGPVVRPLSTFLDRRVGKELTSLMSKKELQKLVQEHSKQGESGVTADEERIISHALLLSETKIAEVMTPRRMIRAVEKSEIVGPKLLNELYKNGHSRFPVYNIDLEHIEGMLYSKELAHSSPQKKKRVEELADSEVYYVNQDQTLEHVLNAFLRTKHHLFIVVNEFKETVGVVSMEDVIEHILGREIIDEFDQYHDLRAVALAAAKSREPVE